MFIINNERRLKRTWHSSEKKAIELGAMIKGDTLVAAPKVPEGMVQPQLSDDDKTWIEAMPQSELDTLKTEQAMSLRIAQRKSRYKEESDPLYLDIIYEAEKAGVKPDLTAWVALKDKIKTEIPKP